MKSVNDGLKRMLEGRYSLLCLKRFIHVVIASQYTDPRGRTPYYISKKGTAVVANVGLVLR